MALGMKTQRKTEHIFFYFVVFLSRYSLEMAGAAAHFTKCHGIASHA
jgi:hypothetical protein